jgi:hypothetical protein
MVFLHRINRLVLLMGMHAIFCTAATKYLYNHSAFHLTTRTWPLPMRNLYRVRCSASFFNLQYPRLSLRSSSRCLRLLPCIPFTFISSSIFPSVMCFRRQFLRKMWPIYLAFLLFILCRIRNTWKVLKCGVGEGWRKSVGPIMWEMKKCYLEWVSRGISYTK